ncbi:MAG TPA: STAS/SEC14 domain-containing protein [Sphingobium sp.]|uniref:STAS/SEC14 domain-containing protein n=1 Tax=Sphingobium sp. TaxID=1912891 RepID=UPI002ED3FEF5
MYEYSFRHDINLLDISWKGPFAPEIIRTYAHELLAEFGHAGFKPGYLLRIDMSESATQPKGSLPVFAEAFGTFPKAERIAIITTSAITALQVKRIMTQPYLRIFDTADAGLAWLLGRIYVSAE